MLKNSAIYLLSSIIEKGCWLLVLPLLSNYFEPKEFGYISYCTIILSLLSIFSSLSVDTVLGKIYNHNFENKTINKEVIKYSILTLIISISLMPFFIFLVIYSIDFDDNISRFMYPLFVMLICFSSVETYKCLLRFENKVYKFAAISLSICITQLLIIYYCVIIKELKGESIIIGQAVSYMLFYLMIVILVTIKLISKKLFNVKIVKISFIFSKRIILYSISNWGTINFDRLIVSIFLNATSMGLYSLSLQFSSIISILGDSMQKAWIPFFHERYSKSDFRSINVNRNYIYICFIFVTSFLIITTTPFVHYFFSNEYNDIDIYIKFLFIVGLLSIYNYLLMSEFIERDQVLLSRISSYALLINVLFSLSLVYYFELLGAMVSLFITKLFYTIMYVYKIKKMKYVISTNNNLMLFGVVFNLLLLFLSI